MSTSLRRVYAPQRQHSKGAALQDVEDDRPSPGKCSSAAGEEVEHAVPADEESDFVERAQGQAKDSWKAGDAEKKHKKKPHKEKEHKKAKEKEHKKSKEKSKDRDKKRHRHAKGHVEQQEQPPAHHQPVSRYAASRSHPAKLPHHSSAAHTHVG